MFTCLAMGAAPIQTRRRRNGSCVRCREPRVAQSAPPDRERNCTDLDIRSKSVELCLRVLRQYREITPEDSELLDFLHKRLPPGTRVRPRLLERLPSGRACDYSTPVCTVCMEDFEPTSQVLVLPCKHVFHPRCITRWLERYHGTCPLCYAPVPILLFFVKTDDESEVHNVSGKFVPSCCGLDTTDAASLQAVAEVVHIEKSGDSDAYMHSAPRTAVGAFTPISMVCESNAASSSASDRSQSCSTLALEGDFASIEDDFSVPAERTPSHILPYTKIVATRGWGRSGICERSFGLRSSLLLVEGEPWY